MTFRRFCGNIFISLICIVLLLPADDESQGAEAPRTKNDASKIVKRVKKTLNGIKTLSCSFEREHVWKTIDRNQHILGTLFMKKPFMLRVEYPGQTIVVDGEKVWSYLPKHNQVQISAFEREEDLFPSPHNIFTQYVNERKALISGEEKIKECECDIICLISSDPDENKVTVWIDRALKFPVKAVEETPSGDVTTHVLSDVRLNEKIDDDVFTFDPPEGVTEIDLRE